MPVPAFTSSPDKKRKMTKDSREMVNNGTGKIVTKGVRGGERRALVDVGFSQASE
jgi:hypothetical protein